MYRNWQRPFRMALLVATDGLADRQLSDDQIFAHFKWLTTGGNKQHPRLNPL